jgi:cytoskeleton protein RodZ
MKKTGNKLRESRESKGISLQEVSIHLKINTRILRALEDGDLEKLPAKTFLRGFVQSYSSYLRIDQDQIMDIFQLEMGSTHPGMITTDLTLTSNATEILPQNPPSQSKNNALHNTKGTTTSPATNTLRKQSDTVEPQAPALSLDSKTWSRYVQIGIVMSALVILGLIIAVKRTIDKYEKEATLASVPENLETVKPLSQEPPAAPPTSQESEKFVPPPPVAVTVAPPPPVPPSTPPQETVNNPQITAPPQPLPPSPPVTNTPPTAAPVAIVGPPTPPPVANQAPSSSLADIKQQIVIVEALDKVTIEYTIDGGSKGSINLKPEGFHTFKAKEKIALVVSDGGSINLIHNGKDKGPPGNLGQPIKLNFP